MNKNQKKVLIGGAIIIVLMFLFPPFHFEYPGGGARNEGYSFIFVPPDSSATVDIGMLLLQWFGVSIVGLILLYILKDK